jgi:hypothetical protein
MGHVGEHDKSILVQEILLVGKQKRRGIPDNFCEHRNGMDQVGPEGRNFPKICALPAILGVSFI